jgi:hypothetical protein
MDYFTKLDTISYEDLQMRIGLHAQRYKDRLEASIFLWVEL